MFDDHEEDRSLAGHYTKTPIVRVAPLDREELARRIAARKAEGTVAVAVAEEAPPVLELHELRPWDYEQQTQKVMGAGWRKWRAYGKTFLGRWVQVQLRNGRVVEGKAVAVELRHLSWAVQPGLGAQVAYHVSLNDGNFGVHENLVVELPLS